MTRVVRAAGGVVVRSGSAGAEVVLVHRPRYDDWALPKGKCDPGESDEDAARREVHEETTLACALLGELTPSAYLDPAGRPKTVRWWVMRPLDPTGPHGFVPNREIDGVRWVPVDEVAAVATYAGDVALVTEALAWLAQQPDPEVRPERT